MQERCLVYHSVILGAPVPRKSTLQHYIHLYPYAFNCRQRSQVLGNHDRSLHPSRPRPHRLRPSSRDFEVLDIRLDSLRYDGTLSVEALSYSIAILVIIMDTYLHVITATLAAARHALFSLALPLAWSAVKQMDEFEVVV